MSGAAGKSAAVHNMILFEFWRYHPSTGKVHPDGLQSFVECDMQGLHRHMNMLVASADFLAFAVLEACRISFIYHHWLSTLLCRVWH